jgi:DNA polymerase III subunit chi
VKIELTEILFYHLTESTLEDALPPLLERSLERGWKVVVEAGSEERVASLNAHLWTYKEDGFFAPWRCVRCLPRRTAGVSLN